MMFNRLLSSFRAILILTVASITTTTIADSYSSLTFVKSDGSKVSYSVQGLMITYDDFAHAVITNNETSDILDLAELEYMYFSNGETWLTGDVNGDGEVNIADINTVIDIILGGTADYDTLARADVNSDSETNLADINTVIDIILNQ